jgi:hypothetical protein
VNGAGDERADGADDDEPMTVREERLEDGRAILFFTFGDDDV